MSSSLPNSKQPRKALYIVYSLVGLMVKLPYYIAESAISPPMKSWSFKKAINVRLLKWFISINNEMGEMIQPNNYLKVVPNPRKDVLGVWINPVEEKYIPVEIRNFAEKAGVKPCRIGGYWYHQKEQPLIGEEQAQPGEQVLYYIHGGGFVHQSAHPDDLISVAANGTLYALNKIRRCLSIEYRLSTGEPVAPAANPFPAALLDIISGYTYLVNTLKFEPKNIIVAGDSCGANLALALTRCVRELKNPSFGMPKALILFSPWVDPGESHITEASTYHQFDKIDYLTPFVKETWAIGVYTAPFEKDFRSTNPYVAPASKALPSHAQNGLFHGFPNTLIFGGDHEQLIESIRTFKARLEADIGEGAVTYVEQKDAIHDIVCFPWFQPEVEQTMQKITEWYSTLN